MIPTTKLNLLLKIDGVEVLGPARSGATHLLRPGP